MRLMYVINNLKLGGAEMRVVDLINGLDPRFSLALACLQFTGELVDELRRRDLSIYNLNVGGEDQFLTGVVGLLDALDDFKPSILHTHLVQASLLGRIAALSSRVRVISTQHHAFHANDDSPLYRIERSTWRLSSGFIALSFAIKKRLRNLGYMGPVHVIPTGIDNVTRVSESANKVNLEQPYILSVGQFRDPQKGHDVLVEAFNAVVDKFDCRLYLVGDGPERERVAAMADALKLGNSVVFLGQQQNVVDLMRRCSIFVLASRWEGFGRVLLEAMSLGCAVVATRVEGIPEIISSGHDGLLVPPGDVAQLADSLVGLLRAHDVRQRLGNAARETVRRRFTLARMLEKESRFYSLVLSRYKG